MQLFVLSTVVHGYVCNLYCADRLWCDSDCAMMVASFENVSVFVPWLCFMSHNKTVFCELFVFIRCFFLIYFFVHDVCTDVNCRLGKAAAVFQRMRSIWASSVISTSTKIWLCNVIVLFVATYARDTWKMTAKIAQKLNVFHRRCLRKLLHISYLDHITNEEVPKRAGWTKLQDIVTERRIHLAGHILRLPSHRHSNIAMRWTPVWGTRKRGRPKKTWRRTFQED